MMPLMNHRWQFRTRWDEHLPGRGLGTATPGDGEATQHLAALHALGLGVTHVLGLGVTHALVLGITHALVLGMAGLTLPGAPCWVRHLPHGRRQTHPGGSSPGICPLLISPNLFHLPFLIPPFLPCSSWPLPVKCHMLMSHHRPHYSAPGQEALGISSVLIQLN